MTTSDERASVQSEMRGLSEPPAVGMGGSAPLDEASDSEVWVRIVGGVVFVVVFALELATIGLLATTLRAQGAPSVLYVGLSLAGAAVASVLALAAARLPHLPAQQRRREREIQDRIMDIVLRDAKLKAAQERAVGEVAEAIEAAREEVVGSTLANAKLDLQEAQGACAGRFSRTTWEPTNSRKRA
jgi:hypothetical protein